jgi:hypothetical protein
VPEHCCAIWPTGERCDGWAVVDDPARAGYICYRHAPPGPRKQEAIRATIRKATGRPDRYLAAVLAEDTDDRLAAQLGWAASVVWRLRLMGWPRVDRWAADVALMAEALAADSAQLDSLLRPLARVDANCGITRRRGGPTGREARRPPRADRRLPRRRGAHL